MAINDATKSDQNYCWLIFGLQLVTKYHRSLSLILGLDVTVGILLRKDIFCCDFILCAVATFWSMSLVGIYPGRASMVVNWAASEGQHFVTSLCFCTTVGDYILIDYKVQYCTVCLKFAVLEISCLLRICGIFLLRQVYIMCLQKFSIFSVINTASTVH